MNDQEKVIQGKRLLVQMQGNQTWFDSFAKHYESTYYIDGRSATGTPDEMIALAAREDVCTLTEGDFEIPSRCPITNEVMTSGSVTSATLDRIDSSKPFEAGNVRVISREAHWCINNNNKGEEKCSNS